MRHGKTIAQNPDGLIHMQEELKNLERIERYFEDQMSEEERKDFEIALLVDTALQNETEVYRNLMLAMKDIKSETIHNRLKELDSELDRTSFVKNRRASIPFQRALLAALVILAIGSTLMLIQRGSSVPSTEADLLPVEEGLPVLMSTSGEKAFDDAMSSFKAGEYDNAYDRFLPLLEQEPANDTLLYFTGNALLRSGRPGDALPLFQKLISSHSSVYGLKAEVYKALCTWETGVKQEAIDQLREISFSEKHPYRKEAGALLNKLGASK